MSGRQDALDQRDRQQDDALPVRLRQLHLGNRIPAYPPAHLFPGELEFRVDDSASVPQGLERRCRPVELRHAEQSTVNVLSRDAAG